MTRSWGGARGFWVSAVYDAGGDKAWNPVAEVAFYEAKSKADPVEDKNPYIIRLDREPLGRDEATIKSSLEEAATRAKDLIESGKVGSLEYLNEAF